MIARVIVSVVSLGLIALGLWFIYPPLSPLVMGSLLWIDLELDGIEQSKGRRRK